MEILSAMAVFARVVEEGSISAAAGRVGLSKSAVSKQLTRLEERLGARLLNRTTRRLSLTEAGAAFYERSARVLAEAEAAELEVGRLQAQPRGTLRINAPVAFGTSHLAPALADFLGRYTGLSVDLTLNDRFVDLVEEGYDLAVRIAALEESSLIARRLGPTRHVVCGAPAYLDRHGRPTAPADLREHNCLGYAYRRTGDVWRLAPLDEPARRIDVRVTGCFRANNGQALAAAAAGGLGLVLMPTFIVGDLLAAGRLEPVLTGYAPPDSGIYAVYPHSRNLSVKVRVLVDFLAARFAREPWRSAIA